MDLDLNKRIDDLSYGNRKKVGIVQGLLHEPKLIILDEPTGGLDPLMQQTFFELLKEENQKGATILFSSHILSEVQKMCDRVAIIKEGKLITVEKSAPCRKETTRKSELKPKCPSMPDCLPSMALRESKVKRETGSAFYTAGYQSDHEETCGSTAC